VPLLKHQRSIEKNEKQKQTENSLTFKRMRNNMKMINFTKEEKQKQEYDGANFQKVWY
jgi:hypothetical protein